MSIVVPSNAQVIIPDCAFLVPRFLSPRAAGILGPQIVAETYSRWTVQMTLTRGWPARPDPGHLMARFGDPGVTYYYKGKPKPIYAFTPGLDQVRTMVVAFLSWIPNCVVVNSYAPSSGLYPHRDGNYIPQLGDAPVIVGVSFGATRTFQLRPVNSTTGRPIRRARPIDVPLSEGDLIVMHGQCDRLYSHGIPEEPNASGTRVSLTFRRHLLA
jgi:alkylated DNA repair dioxygenase AlkB